MISILGCGWLGMPLGKELARIYSPVRGSTTTPEKINEIGNNGMQPFLLRLSDVDPQEIRSFLDNSEILLINVPPGRNNPDPNAYVTQLKALNDYLHQSTIKKVIFISSTSVYKENNAIVTEESEISMEESAQRLFRAEEIFRRNPIIETTVIRLSGLVGPNRHPGRFFYGKENIPNGLAPVNLIHLDDCIGIIKRVIAKNYWGETIHAAALNHPTKEEFYSKATKIYKGASPTFKEENQQFKIINSEKLLHHLDYEFKYPDLMKWLDE